MQFVTERKEDDILALGIRTGKNIDGTMRSMLLQQPDLALGGSTNIKTALRNHQQRMQTEKRTAGMTKEELYFDELKREMYELTKANKSQMKVVERFK